MTNENILNTALLEIGTEELPSSYIEPALKQMENFTSNFLSNIGLQYGQIKTYATPRRLVLFIYDVASKSKDRKEEVLGPSLKAAKDAQGNFTKAAIGFATKNGVKPEKLEIKETPKGQYLCFVKKISGEKTSKILTSLFENLIKAISFPKNMMWEETGFKFARPIRNILALYGNKTIKFTIADVKSANWTIGLHTIDSKKIKISSPEKYLQTIKNHNIIVNQDERKEAIKKSIFDVVKNVGSVIEDESLINEVNYLVEYPTAILCTFDKKYLQLPQEVLTVCMKKSQKCFAVKDKNGIFSNYFIGIKNGVSNYTEMAKVGYEKVVVARLEDAQFFYDNDLKNGLNANVEKLKGVIFNKEIGTIYEKIERMKNMALFFNKEFDFGVDEEILSKAISLSKADLVSEMVFEYPQLQGVMGKIYAQKLGENANLAQALEQHYWPLSASGTLPQSKLSVLISLADKIDTLAANFAIGLEPSGSADPYGLRRAGIGFIRMIIENLPFADLSNVLEKSFSYLPEKIKNNPKFSQAPQRLLNFFWFRIENLLETQGYQSEDVKAVINASKQAKLNALGSLRPKLDALKKAKTKCDFASLTMTFKRINNIVSQAKKQNIQIESMINESLLKEEVEKVLCKACCDTKIKIENYISQSKFDEVFNEVIVLKPSIDNFFAKVMVMDKDEQVKKNRIALLNKIRNIFISFVDFSMI